MDAFSVLSLQIAFITLIFSTGNDGRSADFTFTSTCKQLNARFPDAPSGVYELKTQKDKIVEIYCEMGLDNGGYTFLSPAALSYLTSAELTEMFTDKSSFLFRIRKSDGTQPYAKLSQLVEYSNISLKLGLNEFDNYAAPVNLNGIGVPFLYAGFVPNNILGLRTVTIQGLQVNGIQVPYTICGSIVASFFALFPNFKEFQPVKTYYPGPVNEAIFSNLQINPSGRVMPGGFFMFGEIHFGGCGCYVQSNQIPGVLGFALGFR